MYEDDSGRIRHVGLPHEDVGHGQANAGMTSCAIVDRTDAPEDAFIDGCDAATCKGHLAYGGLPTGPAPDATGDAMSIDIYQRR